MPPCIWVRELWSQSPLLTLKNLSSLLLNMCHTGAFKPLVFISARTVPSMLSLQLLLFCLDFPYYSRFLPFASATSYLLLTFPTSVLHQSAKPAFSLFPSLSLPTYCPEVQIALPVHTQREAQCNSVVQATWIWQHTKLICFLEKYRIYSTRKKKFLA